jgi:D-alanine-D-alanine ligase
MTARKITLREELRESDREAVREIVSSTGFFNVIEVDIAVELVDERLAKGEASGYYFIFAERGGRTVGYICYGPVGGTAASFDIYWIAVEQGERRGGVGRTLNAEAEAAIARRGGRRIYVETSSREQYQSTREFYLKQGYRQETQLADFYGPGDDKVFFVKVLA